MESKVQQGLARLRERLPLEARQQALPPELRSLHRAILRALGERGAAPSIAQMQAWVSHPAQALAALQRLDLVVCDGGGAVTGAYPFTLEQTPHRVVIGDHAVNAMCAVDALGVSPMLGVATRIESVCRVSGERVELAQQGMAIRSALPHRDLLVGIRWQRGNECAAHTLCREMVFLRDAQAARTWQGEEAELRELFTLEQGLAIGAGFFVPLLA